MITDDMRILGIETSCDETAAAVVEDGCRILSNVIASQVDIHARYGGVVPEVASRQHLLTIASTVRRALDEAEASVADVDGVAVTHGPGLAGALLVGVNFAKSFAYGAGVPFVGVNHLEGHVYAAYLEGMDPERDTGFPVVCLIASGGHTELVLMEGHGRYRLLGRTRDDAAGEAFDKAARVLGLGFPGGPAIQRAAGEVRAEMTLPRPRVKGSLDFSFSGLKTAFLRRAQEMNVYPEPPAGESGSAIVGQMAAAFQEAMAEVMVERTIEAARKEGCRGILLGGGVAANSRLRADMERRSPVPLLVPSPSLCTDNGAMIAAAGYRHLVQGRSSPWNLDVFPNLPLG